MSAEAGQGQEPRLRIVRGDASPEEIAALVAVLSARAASAAAARAVAGARPRHRSAWADRSRSVRAAVVPGPGAWRAASRPC